MMAWRAATPWPLVVVGCIALAIQVSAVSGATAGLVGNASGNSSSPVPHHGSVRVARFDFDRVRTPYIFAMALLVAGLAKLAFHSLEILSSKAPESCLLIVFGLIVGAIIKASSTEVIKFTPNLFFFYLLPPIMLEAGYLMKRRAFFDNLNTILLYAVVGTIWNVFAMAVGLYVFRLIGAITLQTVFDFSECLLFGAISAAVDPVAVLAIFDEAHVNVNLFILVFGESILNDAVSVVLYQSAETFVELPTVGPTDITLSFVSFFTVSGGGILIGLMMGLVASLITKYTEHVQILEVLITFVCGYLSFLTAEIFHFSGILSAITCGLVMRHYLHENISTNSQITVKYFMKMSSSASETIIFVFLGLEAVSSQYVWDTGFVLGTLLFAFSFRFVGVFALTYVVNRYRVFPVSRTEQILMGYGGLRGAVSFSLVLLLNETHVPSKDAMFTAAFCLIIFTVFVQGMTIKPLVKYLHIAGDEGKSPTINQIIHAKTIDHITAGIEEIIGQIGDQRLYELVTYYDQKYLTPFLTREDIQGGETLLGQIDRICEHNTKARRQTVANLHPTQSSLDHLSPAHSATAITQTPATSPSQAKPTLRGGVSIGGCLAPTVVIPREAEVLAQDSMKSDDFIRYLFAPSAKDKVPSFGTRGRNLMTDEQLEQRLRMMRTHHTLQQALHQAHYSHHHHHHHHGGAGHHHRVSLRNSRQSGIHPALSRPNSIEAQAYSGGLRPGETSLLKRRVLSEGDAMSVGGDSDHISIATMSDPSIHFEPTHSDDDWLTGTPNKTEDRTNRTDVDARSI